jgi:short-subunit dehydrogenase
MRPAPRSWHRPDDISGEVAVVAGASRGLGLLLARELARHQCPLVICARNGGELDQAAEELRRAGAEVTAVACDITGADAPRLLVDTAVQRYGRLDILVSNAGVIKVGPADNTSAADYEEAWRIMAFAPARLALAALPVMRRQGRGRIVNITSIGGKVSVPHLLPYSTAKFAAVAFSEGLRAELGRGPVTVTTVVPGLMRTGSHLRALFAGHRDQEFTWFGLGASLPLVSMDAERAARQIVNGVRHRRSELILTPLAQVAARGAAVSPELTGAMMRMMQRVLPAPADGQQDSTPGLGLQPALNQRVFGTLTALGRRAAERFNQLPRARPPARAGSPEP